MEIVEFKDYPSTDTPLSAYNLNRMQNNIKTELTNIEQEGIIVSPTEPVTNRRKVWMQKGKNLFDKNKMFFESGDLNSTTGNSEVNTNRIRISRYIEVTPNTAYTLNSSNNILAGRFIEYDENKVFIKASYGIGTIITSANTKYVKWSYSTTSVPENIQLEQNSTATTYEEYIEPKTYILNDNNVYEEFMKKEENIYSTDEQVIGKWIDGKTLYRKTIVDNNRIGAGETLLINHGISNIEEITNVKYGIVYQEEYYPSPVIYDDYTTQLVINKITKTQIHVKSFGEVWATHKLTITIEYTKTTD